VNELARQLSDEIGISEDGGAARESFNQHKLTREGAFGDGMERAGAERWLLHYAKADRSLSDEQRATIADGHSHATCAVPACATRRRRTGWRWLSAPNAHH
jgi:hypothetical protein